MTPEQHARFARLVEKIQMLLRQKLEQRERDALPQLLRPQAE